MPPKKVRRIQRGVRRRARSTPRDAPRRTAPPDISKSEYVALAGFRLALRRFLKFSENGAREVGVTPQQHALLLAVRGQPGRDWASISELSHALQIRHHAAVGLTDRCESAGLVRRARQVGDRRSVRVELTAPGKRILARLSMRNRRELRALRHALQLPSRGDPVPGPRH